MALPSHVMGGPASSTFPFTSIPGPSQLTAATTHTHTPTPTPNRSGQAATSPSNYLLPIPTTGLTPTASTSPQTAFNTLNTAVSSAGPALALSIDAATSKTLAFDALRLSDRAASIPFQPSPPLPIGPHAIVSILGDQHLLRTKWFDIGALLGVIENRIKKSYVPAGLQVKQQQATVLFQLFAYRYVKGSEGPDLHDPLSVDVCNAGPLLASEFYLRGWDSLSEPLVDVCSDSPMTYRMPIELSETRSANSRVMSALEQLSNNVTSTQAETLDAASPLLGHYVINVLTPSQHFQPRVIKLAKTIAPQIRGVATAVFPATASQEATGGASNAPGQLHQAFAQGLDRTMTVEDASALLQPPQDSATRAPPSEQLRGLRVHFAGFREYSDLSIDSNRKRAHDGGESSDDPQAKRTKIVGAEAGATIATATEATPATLAPNYPQIWSGLIAWDVSDAKMGKRQIRLFASAVHGGARSTPPNLTNLLLPWSSTLPLAVLKPIAPEKLKRFITQSGANFVIFHPDLTSPNPTASRDPLRPSTPEAIAENKKYYISLAQTLEHKKSAVWLPLGKSKGVSLATAENRHALESESRTCPGILVASLVPPYPQNQNGASQQSAPVRLTPVLMGLILPTGVPWEYLSTPVNADGSGAMALGGSADQSKPQAVDGSIANAPSDDVKAQVLAMKQRMAMQQAQQARQLQQRSQQAGTDLASQIENGQRPPQQAQSQSQTNFNVTPSGLPNITPQAQGAPNPQQLMQLVQNLPNLNNMPPNFLSALNSIPGMQGQTQQQQLQMLTAAVQLKARQDQQRSQQAGAQAAAQNQMPNLATMFAAQQWIQQQRRQQGGMNNGNPDDKNQVPQLQQQQQQLPQGFPGGGNGMQAPQQPQPQQQPFDIAALATQWGFQPQVRPQQGGQQQAQPPPAQSQGPFTQGNVTANNGSAPNNNHNGAQQLVPNLNSLDVNQLQAMLGMNMR